MGSLASPDYNDKHLSPEEISALEADNVVQPSSVQGKIKVSLAILGPPTYETESGRGGDNADSSERPSLNSNTTSDSTSSSTSKSNPSPNSATATVRPLDFKPQSDLTNTFFDLPTRSVSIAALEFIGFTLPAATSIYNDWISGKAGRDAHVSLLDHVYEHISILNSKEYRDYDARPREAMERIGLNGEFQDALTDERFADIFWTESLYSWVKDTVTINYVTLERVLGRARRYVARRKKSSRYQLQHQHQQQSHLTSALTHTHSPPLPASTITMTLEDHGLPTSHISLIQDEPPTLPGHIVLYKGKATPSRRFITEEDDDNNNAHSASSSSVHMEALASSAGGDFNHWYRAHYWSPDRAVGEKYRAWAARRCPFSETWLIRIQIPVSFINSLKVSELWVSDLENSSDWKEYVWHCKNRIEPPARLRSLWHEQEGADLIVGHMWTAAAIAKPVAKLDKREIQTRITEDLVLRVADGDGDGRTIMESEETRDSKAITDGEATADLKATAEEKNGNAAAQQEEAERVERDRKATQWVFMHNGNIDRLEEEIRGKVHIDITAATRARA